MKKMFALMLAAMMLLAMMPAAMAATSAYTPVTPGKNSQPDLELDHILTLKDGLSELFYEITYTFTTGSVGTTNEGIKNLNSAVSGAPKIAAIVYSSEDNKTPAHNIASKSYTKPLNVNWEGVSIKEPGVYYWPITKQVTDTDNIADATNVSNSFYLYVVATDNGGTLKIDSVFLSAVAPNSLAGQNSKGDITEEYPAQAVNLTLSKTVAGSQGSKNQYFKFEILLTNPANAAQITYNLSGNYDVSVPATAYNDQQANPETVTPGTKLTIWLKDGQNVTINNMLSGTSYTITESNNDGYEVTSKVREGNATEIEGTGYEVSDNSLTASTTVAYTNTKEPEIPTGIELETAAPIVGMILAMAMLALLFVGKRKEEIA